ncbi:hypothetical protein [Acetobacterium sp. KB-1]|jgi:hypothetical protein|uniref:hypothetical protein n=1 Tax=Acetobacterium sp. KB-1 TaxID=2184575 RepID=UPI001955043D|nr:hypothetical protein [Acetobacterium sp. KB-1]
MRLNGRIKDFTKQKEQARIGAVISGPRLTDNGVGGILKETVGDAVTGGWYNALNGENIDLNQMTRIVGEELSRLCGEKGLLKTA